MGAFSISARDRCSVLASMRRRLFQRCRAVRSGRLSGLGFALPGLATATLAGCSMLRGRPLTADPAGPRSGERLKRSDLPPLRGRPVALLELGRDELRKLCVDRLADELGEFGPVCLDERDDSRLEVGGGQLGHERESMAAPLLTWAQVDLYDSRSAAPARFSSTPE